MLLLPCRLQLHPTFLGRQQVLLQARLLHTLLPLQQAAAAPAAAAAPQASSATTSRHALHPNQSTGLLRKQFQRRKHKAPSQQQHFNQPANTSTSLDPGVLLDVLRRVQGFVSGLAEARVEQQQQVLPQLQRLATAGKHPAEGLVTQHPTTSASSSTANTDATTATHTTSSSSSSDVAAASVLQLQPQQLTVPGFAELLDFGNLQQLLLLLERHHLQHQQQ
jgi:hypothetical protein